MEELVLYVPNLEQHFNRRKELQLSTMNYIKEERKLYLSPVVVGALEFQSVLLDFEHNKVTFKREKNVPEELYDLLTSYQLDFQPLHQSFIMHRPQQTKVEM